MLSNLPHDAMCEVMSGLSILDWISLNQTCKSLQRELKAVRKTMPQIQNAYQLLQWCARVGMMPAALLSSAQNIYVLQWGCELLKKRHQFTMEQVNLMKGIIHTDWLEGAHYLFRCYGLMPSMSQLETAAELGHIGYIVWVLTSRPRKAPTYFSYKTQCVLGKLLPEHVVLKLASHPLLQIKALVQGALSVGRYGLYTKLCAANVKAHTVHAAEILLSHGHLDAGLDVLKTSGTRVRDLHKVSLNAAKAGHLAVILWCHEQNHSCAEVFSTALSHGHLLLCDALWELYPATRTDIDLALHAISVHTPGVSGVLAVAWCYQKGLPINEELMMYEACELRHHAVIEYLDQRGVPLLTDHISTLLESAQNLGFLQWFDQHGHSSPEISLDDVMTLVHKDQYALIEWIYTVQRLSAPPLSYTKPMYSAIRHGRVHLMHFFLDVGMQVSPVRMAVEAAAFSEHLLDWVNQRTDRMNADYNQTDLPQITDSDSDSESVFEIHIQYEEDTDNDPENEDDHANENA